MNIDLLLKPKEWHPIGEHKRIRCTSIHEVREGNASLLAVDIDVEWNGDQEQFQLSSDNPEFYARGMQFYYKGGDDIAAELSITLVDYAD